MISKHNFETPFSLVTAQALKSWGDINLLSSPVSEVIDYNTDAIWDDSYYGPQTIPCAHKISSFDYLKTNPDGTSPSFEPRPPNVGSSDPTTNANVYWEVCNNAIDNDSCAFTDNTSTNTAVETTYMSYYYKIAGVWHTFREADVQSDAFQRNPVIGSLAEYKYCTDPAIIDWLDEDRSNPLDNMHTLVDGKVCWTPEGGIYPHPWATTMDFPAGMNFDTDVEAVCVQLFARVVQIDNALPNDFALSNFCTYAGTDTRDASGDFNWSCSVQGKFKSVPQSGAWRLFGVVRGVATKAEWDANPAPLCPTPQPSIQDYSLETIWNDSYYGPQQIPCAHNISGFEYLQTNPDGTSPTFDPRGPVMTPNRLPSVKVLTYFEVCNRAIADASCAFTSTTSTNTAAEVWGMSYHYLKDGIWIEHIDGQYADLYSKFPKNGSTPYNLCTTQSIKDWIDADRWGDYEVLVNGITCWKPIGGTYPHPYTIAYDLPANWDYEAEAVCVQLFSRLVQIDPNLPNDFATTDLVTYAGTDTKDETGTSNFSCSVQGKYKGIPKTGAWRLHGVVRGIADKATFDANPPPLATPPPV